VASENRRRSTYQLRIYFAAVGPEPIIAAWFSAFSAGFRQISLGEGRKASPFGCNRLAVPVTILGHYPR
jgi:hypothetical protein